VERGVEVGGGDLCERVCERLCERLHTSIGGTRGCSCRDWSLVPRNHPLPCVCGGCVFHIPLAPLSRPLSPISTCPHTQRAPPSPSCFHTPTLRPPPRAQSPRFPLESQGGLKGSTLTAGCLGGLRPAPHIRLAVEAAGRPTITSRTRTVAAAAGGSNPQRPYQQRSRRGIPFWEEQHSKCDRHRSSEGCALGTSDRDGGQNHDRTSDG
jgi:hypothetical protein